MDNGNTSTIALDRQTIACGRCLRISITRSIAKRSTRRGLRGVKLVISDANEGLKAAAAKVLKATWQRCRLHFLRNALAHAGKGQRQMVLALINTVFAQETQDAAIEQWRTVADQLRTKFPKLAALMDRAEY